MGERELCKLEVIGSIPFSSTSLRVARLTGQVAHPTSLRTIEIRKLEVREW